ncbi:hypothetical protein J3E73DRAFT_252337 [Bipolaris maydis]|nr:hypothetical protein J3E73DRAFT_252337 [Bipolaris maydis]
MCAIGSLMGLEQDVAIMLSAQVEEFVQGDKQESLDCQRLDRYKYALIPSDQTQRASHAHPIWLLQTKLLLIWFRAFSGNLYVVTDALKEFGFLVNVTIRCLIQVLMTITTKAGLSEQNDGYAVRYALRETPEIPLL